MKTMLLTRGRIAIVDDEDFEMLSHWKWSLAGKGYAYAYNGGGRRHQRYLHMHRLLMLPDPGQEIDHVNGDGLDNRRANLRLCTRSENQHNQRLPRNNTSGYKGVSKAGQSEKWTAQIRKDYRQYHLGYFADPLAAACAYDAAARELHGEFARLNFPEAVRS